MCDVRRRHQALIADKWRLMTQGGFPIDPWDRHDKDNGNPSSETPPAAQKPAAKPDDGAGAASEPASLAPV